MDRAGADVGRNLLLVVEDNDLTRHGLYSIFTKHGWNVLAVSTVAEALALLEREPCPEWVILDLMLPDGSGEDVLTKIRKEKLKTRVIVLTALYDPERLQPVNELHPEAFLQKPIDLQAVCRLCESPFLG